MNGDVPRDESYAVGRERRRKPGFIFELLVNGQLPVFVRPPAMDSPVGCEDLQVFFCHGTLNNSCIEFRRGR